jgi:fructose-1,6-bisphosphatase I
MRASGKKMSARYIGSLVADFHRNLLEGRHLPVPRDRPRHRTGKLRLLVRSEPARLHGGTSRREGHRRRCKRILDLKPTELHQRCPLYIGSSNMVDAAMTS